MRAEDKDVLNNIRYDSVLLKGVGGSIRVHEAGDFTFGKTRIGTDYNLVSQHESGKIWQLVNPAPDKFYLKGWERTGYENKRFNFLRDRKRYGDNLLHCALPKSEFQVVFSKLKIQNTVYRPKTPKDESKLSDAQTQTIDTIDSVHWDMGHPSAQALERTATQLDLERSDIALWKEYC
jgi:hypothetical protein